MIAAPARRLYSAAPGTVKSAYRRARSHYRSVASGTHLLPGYLVIGAARAGSTSLYHYLVAHPLVGPAATKEVHYFDRHYDRGLAWYRTQFPTVLARELARRRHGGDYLTGEASPYYLFHPGVPARVAETLPDVRLVALLRDPIHRAYSHYQHNCRRGYEELSFEEAVEREPERTQADEERLAADPSYVSDGHRRYSYVARGEYAAQLERWLARFPRERLLVLRSEDFFADPGPALRQVTAFLGLPPWEPARYPVYNQSSYPELRPETRARLAERFRPHNARLAELLGRDFGWDA